MVEDGDEPTECLEINRGRQREPSHHRFGARDREVLGEQFAEEHLHEGREQQRCDRADTHADRGGDADAAHHGPQRLSDQGFGYVTDEQAGDGDAQLCAGQHERRALGDLQCSTRNYVAFFGARLQAGPVHGHVGEFLRHEVAGGHRDEKNYEEAEQKSEHCTHSPDTASHIIDVVRGAVSGPGLSLSMNPLLVDGGSAARF